MCNGTSFTVEKISPQAGLELGTAGSVGHRLTNRVTGAPLRIRTKVANTGKSIKTIKHRLYVGAVNVSMTSFRGPELARIAFHDCEIC